LGSEEEQIKIVPYSSIWYCFLIVLKFFLAFRRLALEIFRELGFWKEALIKALGNLIYLLTRVIFCIILNNQISWIYIFSYC
jgi:hypothetical protein